MINEYSLVQPLKLALDHHGTSGSGIQRCLSEMYENGIACGENSKECLNCTPYCTHQGEGSYLSMQVIPLSVDAVLKLWCSTCISFELLLFQISGRKSSRVQKFCRQILCMEGLPACSHTKVIMTTHTCLAINYTECL